MVVARRLGFYEGSDTGVAGGLNRLHVKVIVIIKRTQFQPLCHNYFTV